MIPLTIKSQESYEKYICKKQFEHKYNKDKSYHKVQDHCHYMLKTVTAHSICHLKCSISKEIAVVFHNGSKYYYHFIIKRLT